MLILGVLIYRHWPNVEDLPAPPLPEVELTPEIAQWFQKARVIESTAGGYRVELVFTDAFRSSLSFEPREARLGYQYIGSQSVLARGAVPCRLSGNDASAKVLLPNNERVAAREIRLHLAR